MKAASTAITFIVLIVLAVIFLAVASGGAGLIPNFFDAIKSLVLRMFPQLAGVSGNTPETPLEQAIYASYLRCAEGCDAVLNSPYITDDSVLAQACGRNQGERLLMDLFDNSPNNQKVDKICDDGGLKRYYSSEWAIKVNPNEHFELSRISLAADCMVDVQSPRGSIGWEDVIQNFISTFTGGGKWAFINSKDLKDKIPAANCVGRTEHVVFQSGTTKIETWVSTELRANIHKFTGIVGGYSYCLIYSNQETPCIIHSYQIPLAGGFIPVYSLKRLYNEIANENIVIAIETPPFVKPMKLTIIKVENGQVRRNSFNLNNLGDEISFCKYKFKLKRSGLEAEFGITYVPTGVCP
jgi:hypothetical protein